MTPKDLFLVLNFKTRLEGSISFVASIVRVPLIHVIVGLSRVIQVIQIICRPRRALLVIPHEHGVESGLRQLRLCIYQDNITCFRGLMLGNHLHRAFLFDDDPSGVAAGVGTRGGTTTGGVAMSPPSSSSSSSSSLQLYPYMLANSMMSSS
jgi:hypothetical protein